MEWSINLDLSKLKRYTFDNPKGFLAKFTLKREFGFLKAVSLVGLEICNVFLKILQFLGVNCVARGRKVIYFEAVDHA